MRALSIFDQTERKKQQGIEAAYQHANSVWKKAAATRMYVLAKTRYSFTSDDILTYLEDRGIVTGNNKAVSAILQAGARSGIIHATDQFIRSRRPQRHHAPVMVWQSNISARSKNIR